MDVRVMDEATTDDPEQRHLTDRLTPVERAWIGKYLRDLADHLGLRDWTIQVMHALVDNQNHAASAGTVIHQRELHVWFRGDFPAMPPEDQRTTCIHELLHAHHQHLTWYLRQQLKKLLGMAAGPILEVVDHEHELMVDQVAREIAQHYPLPPTASPLVPPGVLSE